ncbi:peptidoglycan -binding protein [Jannaschia donghaensis]|uniref:Flagellar motor protein MotD n=1 Tax=Jannaschia donghaensis TaxID=420998 RepID=A0A0M6YGG0_9RHOB|nr:peptidoglycan -binding protein [Jannaschia donghaensis]CTQ48166.1 flagellar motor protein MotD [Jannaschia donghaensis]
MAFARRNGQRFTANVWPGFVDAMTALLLVLMFVLSIFMIVQFVLSETIEGQSDTIEGQGQALEAFSAQVASLSRALGLENARAAALEDDVAELGAERDTQAALIATLSAQRDDLTSRVATFEEQVASLIATRDRLSTSLETTEGERSALAGQLATTEGELTRIIDEREALQLALAAARNEIDESAEVARLAAARREAVEALLVDLRAESETRQATLAQTLAALDGQRDAAQALQDQVTDLEASLDETESARLAELAAAQALRERLADADADLTAAETERLAEAAAAEALRSRLAGSEAELTAMTLALEAQRREAEETLTLLAATQTARDDLTDRLAQALADLDDSRAGVGDIEDRLATALARLDAGDATEADLRAEVARLQATLDARGSTVAEADARRTELERRLNEALAARDAAQVTQSDLRDDLAAELARRLAAEEEEATALTDAERMAALLGQARAELAQVDDDRIVAQREAAVLNQQVAELRAQLGGLQNLLSAAEERDAEAQIQIDTLGSRLNTALAQVASEEKARAERLAAEAAELERFRSEFFGQLRDVFDGRDGIEIVGDRFVFSSEVLFPQGDVELQAEGRQQIAQVADIILDVADQIPPNIDWVLRIDGHTDDVPLSGFGRYANNWELSQGRALSVALYLIEALGVPPDRVAPTGFGEFRPVDTADTDAARARNRRIELKLTER